MKTRSMTLFDYFFFGAFVVEVFTVIAGWDWVVMYVHSDVAAYGGGPDMQVAYAAMAPWLVALSLASSVALWSLISVFRFGIFRYLFAIFVALEVTSLLGSYLDGGYSTYAVGYVFLISGLLSTGLKICAVVVSFRKDAGAWLRREV